MALQTYKTKRTGATKRPRLLARARALKARFQGIAKEIYATKATMADACVATFFSLTAAQYAAGDAKTKSSRAPSRRAAHRGPHRQHRHRQVAVFRASAKEGTDHLDTLGGGGGGTKIGECAAREVRAGVEIAREAGLAPDVLRDDGRGPEGTNRGA